MLNLRTMADQHSSQGIKLSRRPSPPQTMLNLMTVIDQNYPKVPNSADRPDTPVKLYAQTGVELNDCSRSTFLPGYQIQPTHLLSLTHRLV